MVSESFKLYMHYILLSNCIIKSLKHKLNCCFGRYITWYGVPRCDCDWCNTILNHFKRVFLNHTVAPDWGNVHTFKNNAFILPLSHSKISGYPELGARLYESFFHILATCQKSTPGVPRGTPGGPPGYFFKIWILHKKDALQACAKSQSWKYFRQTLKLFNIHIFSCMKHFQFIRNTCILTGFHPRFDLQNAYSRILFIYPNERMQLYSR